MTGSDSGIGPATAVAFAEEGADVVVTYLHDQEGAKQHRSRGPTDNRPAIRPARAGAGGATFRETAEQIGVANILVNNAGVDATGTEVADMSVEDWDSEMKTNVYGPFYCCQQFMRGRRANGGGGKIINITSIHQEVPRAGAAGYDVAKAGLRNLTRTLALAPDHINGNNIAPGMVRTPLNQGAIDDPEIHDEQVQSIPWKRAAQPREIARLAVYLASEDADYATGQTFTLDGGLTMNTGQGA